MTDQTLAAASDLAVWGTIAVLALAMCAFAAHVGLQSAARAPQRSATARADAAGADGDTLVLTGAEPPADAGAPTRRWGVIGMQLTWLATLLLVAAAAMRGWSVGRAPLGNMYEFALMAATFALVIFSGWSLRRDVLWLGAFVTLPVLLVLGMARMGWYTEASQLLPSLNSAWLVIHVTMATLTVGLFLIGAVYAVLYLLKDNAEKAAGPVAGWRAALPSAAALERTTHAIHVVAFPLWTFAVMSGAIWAEQAWGRYWGWDPKEVWSFVIWVVYAAYLHARATSGWTTRRSTWLVIAGFACVVINFGVVNIFLVGWHSYSGM